MWNFHHSFNGLLPWALCLIKKLKQWICSTFLFSKVIKTGFWPFQTIWADDNETFPLPYSRWLTWIIRSYYVFSTCGTLQSYIRLLPAWVILHGNFYSGVTLVWKISMFLALPTMDIRACIWDHAGEVGLCALMSAPIDIHTFNISARSLYTCLFSMQVGETGFPTVQMTPTWIQLHAHRFYLWFSKGLGSMITECADIWGATAPIPYHPVHWTFKGQLNSPIPSLTRMIPSLVWGTYELNRLIYGKQDVAGCLSW